VTHDDISNEPGAKRIAHRSTQATDPLRYKRHWTEIEVWFRPDAGERPPFVAVVLGCTSVDGQSTRETVTEAATLRLALSYIGDGLPAQAVRQQALAWMDRYTSDRWLKDRARVVVARMGACSAILELIGAKPDVATVSNGGAIMAVRITTYHDQWGLEWELEQSNGGETLYRIAETIGG